MQSILKKLIIFTGKMNVPEMIDSRQTQTPNDACSEVNFSQQIFSFLSSTLNIDYQSMFMCPITFNDYVTGWEKIMTDRTGI